MPCDHLGPQEIIAMAEEHLRRRGLTAEEWRGHRFRHGENPEGAMWASVVIEIERRGDEWIVTRLDRGGELLHESQLGLQAIS